MLPAAVDAPGLALKSVGRTWFQIEDPDLAHCVHMRIKTMKSYARIALGLTPPIDPLYDQPRDEQ